MTRRPGDWTFVDHPMLAAVRDRLSHPIFDRTQEVYHMTPGADGLDDLLAQDLYVLADGLEMA